MLSENVISEKAFSDHVIRGVLVPDQKSRFLRPPTLMGTKNLNENGPNPCVFFYQKYGQSQSYGNSFVWHGFDNKPKLMRERYKNEVIEWKWPPIFQNKRVRYSRRADDLKLYSRHQPISRFYSSCSRIVGG